MDYVFEVLVPQLCLTLYPMDCSPPGSSVHGILQARILEWVSISFSRASSWSRNQTQVSHSPARFFTIWTTRKALDHVYKICIEFVTVLLLFYVLVLWPWGMFPVDLSSLTRDWTCIPCIGRHSLNHWTTKKAPFSFIHDTFVVTLNWLKPSFFLFGGTRVR